MIRRFYLYSFLKNLRFADPFLIIFLLEAGLSYFQIGWVFGMQHLVTVLLEFPSGVIADHWGRRRCLVFSFLCYTASFVGFGITNRFAEPPLIAWFGGCLAFFAVGEAFRTGSHKAIMLDYLDSSEQAARATQVLGGTRSVSKFTSAMSAICGGLILFWLRDYKLLFFLSAAANACGFLLMLSYPRELEGEQHREHRLPEQPKTRLVNRRLYQLGRRRRFWALIVQSVLFESQIKIILKYYLQPLLKVGLGLYGIAITAPTSVSGLPASGAVWVGLNEFVRDSLGGLGARMSPLLESRVGSRIVALNAIYASGLVTVMAIGACTSDLHIGLLPALLLVAGLTTLQNLRRPLFVSAFNDAMEKSRRASALSLESVARAMAVAVLLPLYGWAADWFGLVSVWILAAGILLLGLLSPNRNRVGGEKQQ